MVCILWTIDSTRDSKGRYKGDIMKIMSGQCGTPPLCAFLIILSSSLLQRSTTAAASITCTSRATHYATYSPCSLTLNQNSCNASNECEIIILPNGSLTFDTFDIGPALLYILIDLAPLMIYFPVLILFNFNLAAGPAQGFVFFYQVLPAPFFADTLLYLNALTGGFSWGLLAMQSPINDIVFYPTLPFIALQYCKLAFVAVVVIVTVLLVKCVACPCASWRRPWAKLRRSVRHFRRKHAQKGTVLNGLCSIVVLTYGFVIQQSLTVLQPARCCPGGAWYCSHYCVELEYFSVFNSSLGLIPLAALVILVLFLSLPLLLLYYPCVPALMQRITKRSSPLITCHKLAPVFDVFQGAYKPKLRFFAAFPLLYRLLIWMLFSGLAAVLTEQQRNAIITLVLILILALHSVIQPYRKPRHNYIEALYLVNLVLISVVYGLVSFEFHGPRAWYQGNGFYIPQCVAIALALLPMVVCTGYIIWKCNCSQRCRAACCRRVHGGCNWNGRESGQEEAVQVPPSEAYLNLDDEELEETITIK